MLKFRLNTALWFFTITCLFIFSLLERSHHQAEIKSLGDEIEAMEEKLSAKAPVIQVPPGGFSAVPTWTYPETFVTESRQMVRKRPLQVHPSTIHLTGVLNDEFSFPGPFCGDNHVS